MRLFAFLLAALAATPAALAQATPEAPPAALAGLVETAEGARLFTAGHDALLDWRLDEAEAAFEALGIVEPQSAAGLYGLEKVALWQALVMERDPYASTFEARNEALRDRLDDLPESAWHTQLEGEALMHRAILAVRQERYAPAGRAFHGACGRFKDLTRDEPFAEALLGRAVCLVAAGSVPREYRWVARLLGFSGTVKDGLAMTEQATQQARVGQAEAVLFLAIADAALNERRAGGIERLGLLAETRPESPLLAYFHGTMLLEQRDAAVAEAVLRRAALHLETEGVAPLPFVDHALGLALFRQDRFEEAADHFEAFTRGYRGEAFVAQAWLHLGLSRELDGNRRRAEAAYRRVRSSREMDSDQQAIREAARRLDHPLTPNERSVLLGATAYDGGRNEAAIRALQVVVTDRAEAATLRAEAAYRTGRAYQALGQPAEALRHYALAVANPGDPLAKWGPWAVYHQGEVHESEGDLEAAREAYERALENEEPFDYYKSMEQRAKAALERIERAGEEG